MSTPAEKLTDIKPGLYPDITNEQYHKGPGISSSGVKLIIEKSPLHYWERYLNPKREPDKETPDMLLGSLVHTMVLEPDNLERDWAVEPDVNKRTKAGREEVAAFYKRNQGKKIVSRDSLSRAEAIASAVRRHPKAAKIFEDGVHEQSLYWVDPDTGVLCKCRPDWWRSFMLADLKTTIDASEDGFQRAVFNFGYHISAAMYLDGVKEHTGEPLEDFVFSVVEKEPPYAVANYRINEEDIAIGRKQYKQALETYARCMEKGTERRHWPGYPLEIQPISLPPWARRKIG